MALPGIPGFSTGGGSMAFDTGADGESGDVLDSSSGGGVINFGAPVYNYGAGNRTTSGPVGASGLAGWQQYIPIAVAFVLGMVLVKAVK